MRYQSPKGTLDILPEDQAYWRHVKARARYICALYGYSEIETPVFEYTPVFARGIGQGTDIVDKEMYTFEDKGGDSLTLRPEFTAGVVRAYLEHGMHVRTQPVRLYSLGPAFRHERPQAGRYREFHQLNVEAIGEQDPAVDLEIMLLTWHLYDDLGFKGLAFQINSTGCPNCRPTYLNDHLLPYLHRQVDQLAAEDQRRLERNPLRVLDSKEDPSQAIIESAPRIIDFLCEECRLHFEALRSFLELLDRPYTLNHRLVRGLDYYTKTVFEIWAQGIGAQNALGGGGRYDGLAEALGGPPTPGVGVATGLERIILLLKEQAVQVPPLPGPEVFVAYRGAVARRAAVELAAELRAVGIATLGAVGDRSLKAQMKQADREGVQYVLILGDDEIAAGSVTVREMATSEQTAVARHDVLDYLRRSS